MLAGREHEPVATTRDHALALAWGTRRPRSGRTERPCRQAALLLADMITSRTIPWTRGKRGNAPAEQMRSMKSRSTPVSRFRSSPEFAAHSGANFGIEGHWPLYDSSAALNPKFAIGLAALWCELRVRGTSRVGHSFSRYRLLRLARLDVGASCCAPLIEFGEPPFRIRMHDIVRLPGVLLRPRPAMGRDVENDA